jgi:hypothetical protein
MLLGVRGLKRAAFLGVPLVLLAACSNYSQPQQQNTNLKFRAFVSQQVTAGGVTAGLDIVDASLNRLVRAPGILAGGVPTLMVVATNRSLSLVFDSSNHSINVVDNKGEASAGSVTLPDWTESMAITADATVGYAAVPNAPVAAGPAGEIEMLNLTNRTVVSRIPVPAVRYIVLSPDGTRLLAFSDNSDTATLVTITNLGTTASPNWVFDPIANPPQPIAGLDRPVWAAFSPDSSTAYILNCGAECGGAASGVAVLSLPTSITTTLPVPGGATFGVLLGLNLYVAGTTPGTLCASGTTAPLCGTFSVINISNPSTPQLTTSAEITDGYHNRMAVTADNQVFVGSHHCSLPTDTTEKRGCLAIFNGSTNSIIIGTDPGDVTGIAPVTGRNEVYVVQNGELRIWNTTTGTLLPDQQQIDISGQAIDVKIVD